jgi:hypothetical protein
MNNYQQRIEVVAGLRRAFEKFRHHREFTRRVKNAHKALGTRGGGNWWAAQGYKLEIRTNFEVRETVKRTKAAQKEGA